MDKVQKYIDSLTTDDNNFKEIMSNILNEESTNISLIILQSEGCAGISSFLNLCNDKFFCTDKLNHICYNYEDKKIMKFQETETHSKDLELLKEIEKLHKHVNINNYSYETRAIHHLPEIDL